MDEKLEHYKVGAKAWFKDKEEGFVSATLTDRKIVDKSILKLTFVADASKKPILYEQTLANLEKPSFDDLPHLKNESNVEGIEDMTNLTHLNEGSVLNSVKLRYQQEKLYTYSGLVLVAMNPFKEMNIYSQEVMKKYCGRSRFDLEPHVFAIAEEAYRKMANENINQSIIVSGESGSGKTQSAKLVMRYFAVVQELLDPNSNQKSSKDTNSIEDAVLSTNPIMEAFGNAKTTRNDNSSRFGKYLEILFDQKPSKKGVCITGAHIKVYLLERSRLTVQAASERNFHIFYQMCAVPDNKMFDGLGIKSCEEFFYLKQGKMGVIKGIDDREELNITIKGMSVVCAALLHMGNIKLVEKNGFTDIDSSDPALLKTAELLGLNAEILKKWFVVKKIVTRDETILSTLPLHQATTSRDSVARYIYSKIFDYIVKIVNLKLNPITPDVNEPKKRSIGVLDIYGFEYFQKNSFEQFCINYANEKLQQEFTRHVFRLEQEQYVQEQISWSFINFTDNQPCIEMIEKKLGIMDVLEAETRSPVGTDKSLIIRFNERFANNEHKFFAKGRFGETDFVIKHYALDINYQIEGFIEKNKDNVTDDQYELLSNSSFPFLKEILFEEQIIEELSTSSALLGSAQGQPKPNKKTSLGSIFKGSLIKLMATLDKTNPHFIRCIKPNQSKSPFKFEPPNVLSQLVACGVLETIRISRAGFPSKEIYSVFVDRYHFLVHSEYWKDDPKKLTENICKTYLKDDNKFALGLSKVFFRAGQIAKLEKIRTENYNRKLQTIKKNTMIYYHKVKYDRAIVNPKLQTEIVNSLVSKLIVPLQDNKKVLNKQEIVFSAHLIGSMLFEFLQSTINVPEFFKRVLKGIQQLTAKFEDDKISAFWLSNSFELLSVLKAIEEKITKTATKQATTPIINKISTSLRTTMVDIYQCWMKETKKKIITMVVPAVVEHESIGIGTKSNPNLKAITVDKLAEFLTSIMTIMKSFFVEANTMRQIIIELIHTIGVTAFNNLLSRKKGYCSWARGIQIEYNIACLDEWCDINKVSEANFHLTPLMQASKLLTAKKKTSSDILKLCDLCFLLNPTQIKKFLTLYDINDKDSPLAPNFLDVISSTVVGEKDDTLFLNLEDLPEFTLPDATKVGFIDSFIPPKIELPLFRSIYYHKSKFHRKMIKK